MYSQAPVLARALQTDPDAIGHTDPLGVERSTLKAKLESNVSLEMISGTYININTSDAFDEAPR